MVAEPQPLSSLISVHQRYARSVHLERDFRGSFGSGYILTESADHLLKAVLSAVNRTGASG